MPLIKNDYFKNQQIRLKLLISNTLKIIVLFWDKYKDKVILIKS